MTKICTFLLTVFFILRVEAAGAGLSEEEMVKINKDCLSSSGVDPNQITKIRSGEFVSNPEVHKFYGCMLRGVGVINDKGQLQVDVMKARAPKNLKKDEALKVFLTCKDKKGGSVDETAYLLYKCFWENSPSHLALDGH